MTLEELRAEVDRMEAVSKKAPDDFETVKQYAVAFGEGPMAELHLKLCAEEYEVLATLPTETAEKLLLLERARKAYEALLQAGRDWIKIQSKDDGLDR